MYMPIEPNRIAPTREELRRAQMIAEVRASVRAKRLERRRARARVLLALMMRRRGKSVATPETCAAGSTAVR
jgi:hypothetical protein